MDLRMLAWGRTAMYWLTTCSQFSLNPNTEPRPVSTLVFALASCLSSRTDGMDEGIWSASLTL